MFRGQFLNHDVLYYYGSTIVKINSYARNCFCDEFMILLIKGAQQYWITEIIFSIS